MQSAALPVPALAQVLDVAPRYRLVQLDDSHVHRDAGISRYYGVGEGPRGRHIPRSPCDLCYVHFKSGRTSKKNVEYSFSSEIIATKDNDRISVPNQMLSNNMRRSKFRRNTAEWASDSQTDFCWLRFWSSAIVIKAISPFSFCQISTCPSRIWQTEQPLSLINK